MTGGSTPDPTQHSRWRPLRLLQDAMDADIAKVYAEARIGGLKPSFVLELLRLHASGPMTITELARAVLAEAVIGQPLAGPAVPGADLLKERRHRAGPRRVRLPRPAVDVVGVGRRPAQPIEQRAGALTGGHVVGDDGFRPDADR